jgi:hypothetical protein
MMVASPEQKAALEALIAKDFPTFDNGIEVLTLSLVEPGKLHLPAKPESTEVDNSAAQKKLKRSDSNSSVLSTQSIFSTPASPMTYYISDIDSLPSDSDNDSQITLPLSPTKKIG